MPAIFFSALKKGVLGIVICQLFIAISIFIADIIIVTQAMAETNWDGAPDLDIIFTIGVLIRVFTVNIVLLPAAILGYFLKRNNEDAK